MEFGAMATATAAPQSTHTQGGQAQEAHHEPNIVIETSDGAIHVELFQSKAPATVANFLRYVEAGAYSHGSFHRTVRANNQPTDQIRIDVIQANDNNDFQKHEFAPIRLETTKTTGLHHLNGTLSMARDTPDSATASFFICIGEQPSLDFGGKRNPDGQGFGAFGRVTDGMKVVRAIQQAKAEAQLLQPPIEILRVSRCQ